VKTALALAHLAACRQEGIGKGANLLFGLTQQMQRQALGGARTDPGQALELINQPSQGSGETAQGSAADGATLERVNTLAVVTVQNGRGPTVAKPAMPLRSLWSVVRRWRSLATVLVLGVVLASCSAAAAGLNSFQSPDGRYAFLYPTGWTRVQVSGGPQVVFHDLINSDETLSLVISSVDADDELSQLGSAVAVGERLRRTAIAPEGSGRDATLVEARERQDNGHTFYDLEYAVHLADRDRHELATVVVDRGRLYTLAASTNEVRWPKVKGLFDQVIRSFSLLV
jgi:photosystem II oxygen-evolving enhancer protein 2